MPVRDLAVPHAARARDALEREYGENVRASRLWQALNERAASDVPSDPETYRTPSGEPEPIRLEVRVRKVPTWEPPWWVYVLAWAFLLASAWWWFVR